MTRDQYVELIKNSAVDMGKRALIAKLAASVPFFAGGLPAKLAALIIDKVVTELVKQTEFGLFFLYVDMRVDKQGSDFEKAAIEWFNASPDEKEKYEKAYLEKFYNLASLRS